MEVASNVPLIVFWFLFLALLIWIGMRVLSHWNEEE